MKVVYTIEVELDFDSADAAQPPEYHGERLTDTHVADMMRQLFYEHSDRYMDDIHATVNLRYER